MDAFEKLDVWKRSCRLSVDVYGALRSCRDYGIRDQITRSALSVPSNIAEGYERDSGNTAIITTAAAHGLRDGNVVTVRGFTGAIPETFNVTNTRITVTSSTTFEYYNAGDTVAETADTNGVVDLAGTPTCLAIKQTRAFTSQG